MPDIAPPPPPDWAGFREENRRARAAEPGLSHVPTVGDVPLLPRLYEVVGPHTVFGAAPGETVELVLTTGQANALIEAGHLAVAVAYGPSPEAVEGDGEEAPEEVAAEG